MVERKQRIFKTKKIIMKQKCECTDECLGYLTKECKRIEEPKQETLEEAAVIYAHRSFIWPLNKQGEKQSIPPGQLVPSGYSKHQKVAIKHFIDGAKWQQERSYSEEDLEVAFFEGQFGKYSFNDWFKQFKKK